MFAFALVENGQVKLLKNSDDKDLAVELGKGRRYAAAAESRNQDMSRHSAYRLEAAVI